MAAYAARGDLLDSSGFLFRWSRLLGSNSFLLRSTGGLLGRGLLGGGLLGSGLVVVLPLLASSLDN